jgi:ATP-grasp domain/L-amino acid ligase C-terminal domain 2/ATP-grasp N-terminal domain
MPRILILATTTGYQTRAFGDAAARLGVELVFATDRCHMLEDPWQDGAIPVRFHDEEASVDAIVEAARTRPLDGILAVGDRPTVIAARAAERLGLAGHPPGAAAIARNKRLFRERLRDAGLPAPSFVVASVDAEPRAIVRSVSFPAVIKPAALSGSRGVMRIDDAAGLRTAFARLRTLLQSPDVQAERDPAHRVVLVEDFIPGRELAIEALLDNGTLHLLALFDKPDPLDGPFFEETIYVTPSSESPEVQRAIVDAVADAAAAVGLQHGPIHAECRVTASGKIFILEVAARPIGGLCARALRFRPGSDTGQTPNGQKGSDPCQTPRALEELLLRHALGESPDGWTREADASGVMMIPIPRRGVFRGVSGIDAAEAVDGVDDVRITAKPDQLLVPLPEGASYLGFIFARGADPRFVERALREAHARLEFVVDPEFQVVQSRHG